jgi:serine protease inhibitor
MFHPPDCSRNQPFYRKDGTEISVPTMQSDYLSLNYAQNDCCQAVELPYKGEKFSMLVLLRIPGGSMHSRNHWT